MFLSVIIPYTFSKDENRAKGLTALMESLRSQDYYDFETIVVEDLQGKVTSLFPHKEMVDKLITISDPKHRKFNKSWNVNVGAKQASSDNLLFIDAELSFGHDFLKKVLGLADIVPFFSGWTKFVCMPGRDNPKERIHLFPPPWEAMLGTLFSKKEFFFKRLGGFNENYFGYGGEDNDVFYRAKHILRRTPPALNYTVFHNYHHWHPADGPDPLSLDMKALFEYTRDHPQEIIDRLLKADLGNVNHPTLI